MNLQKSECGKERTRNRDTGRERETGACCHVGVDTVCMHLHIQGKLDRWMDINIDTYIYIDIASTTSACTWLDRERG